MGRSAFRSNKEFPLMQSETFETPAQRLLDTTTSMSNGFSEDSEWSLATLGGLGFGKVTGNDSLSHWQVGLGSV